MELSVLLVEDNEEDLKGILAGLPVTMGECKLKYHVCTIFDEARERVRERRYDLVISDTYRGAHKDRDAQVLELIKELRRHRFVPVIACSSGEQPAEFTPSAFMCWADKTQGNKEIIAGIESMLATGIPQIARKLHEDLDIAAAKYLWEFLEGNWNNLAQQFTHSPKTLERIVRRRASVFLGEIDADGEGSSRLQEFDGPEYYIYPSIVKKSLRLGEILIKKDDDKDRRIVLTPHCHLTPQGEKEPRASSVLTAKIRCAGEVLQEVTGEKRTWAANDADNKDQLRRRTQSPPSSMGEPAGRYWYLPQFLEIPHAYCDFMQVESIERKQLIANYKPIATLASPFAEAFQSCFTSFYGSVGIPPLRQDSVASMLSLGVKTRD